MDVSPFYKRIGHNRLFRLACKRDDLKTIEFLLRRKTRIFGKTRMRPDWSDELAIAYKRSNNVFITMIKICSIPRDLFEKYINLSCVNGNIELLKYMTRDYDSLGDTLERACSVGNYEMVKYITDRIGRVNGFHNNGLRHACVNGHYDIVLFLLEQGANLDDRNGYFLESIKNNPEIVELLLEKCKPNSSGGYY
jgi:Ankyrin repeats (3 copies)